MEETKTPVVERSAFTTGYTIEISQKLSLLLTSFIVVIAIFMAGQLFYQFRSLPQNMPTEISINGEGKIYVKPDIAMVNFGVETQGLKSQDTVNQNNEKMNKIIEAVKALGVDEKDIQTTLYNLNPVYDYTNWGRVFKGYSLNQQVTVKIRNFDKINDILDKATLNGANRISDIQFTVDDMEKFRAEARAKAIEMAKEKALVLANQAGLKIEKLVNIYEGGNSTPQPFYNQGFGGAQMEKSTAPQIEVGQLEVAVSVTLTYRIR